MNKQLSREQRSYQRRYGLLFGGIFAAAIGGMWGIGTAAYMGTLSITIILVSSAITISLILFAFMARRWQPLGKGSLPYLHSWIFWTKFYGIVIIEVLAIYISINWLTTHHHDHAIVPLIAFIVAAHFASLGRINGITLWYGTTLVVGLIVISTVLLIPESATITLGGITTDIWTLVTVSVFTLSLWCTSLGCILLYRRIKV